LTLTNTLWRSTATPVDDVGDHLICSVADRDRPFARIDQAGLLWVLNGANLVALTENTATIETRTGARQTYRRRPVSVGEILLACFSR
jgi:hypothetical protein